MGKHGKKAGQSHRRDKKSSFTSVEYEGEETLEYPSANSFCPEDAISDTDKESQEENEILEKVIDIDINPESNSDVPSKFSLYQQSVQSPKGDISYLLKFFLMYVGGRIPLHLQEDFCGTALLSTAWLNGDARRTAVGIDLDIEALNWSLANNVNRIGADIESRISLFHGNVLQPLESKLTTADSKSDPVDPNTVSPKYMKDIKLPAKDIVCAFNYSCCCLHSRKELVLYFKNALTSLSKKGGIFVMDLYGGTSSEGPLRLQRKFAGFTYMWEQAEFDVIERKTRISLHFNLHKQKKGKLRHAFSYTWRLWSLPEVKDCLEEAGFSWVHFWICKMPESEDMRCTDGLSGGRDVKYEETTSFQQQDSWNAYIVGVA